MSGEFGNIQWNAPSQGTAGKNSADSKDAHLLFPNGYLIGISQHIVIIGPQVSECNAPCSENPEGTFAVAVYAPGADGTFKLNTTQTDNDFFDKGGKWARGWQTRTQVERAISYVATLPKHENCRDNLAVINAKQFSSMQMIGGTPELEQYISTVGDLSGDLKSPHFLKKIAGLTVGFNDAVIVAQAEQNLSRQDENTLRHDFAAALKVAGIISKKELKAQKDRDVESVEGTVLSLLAGTIERFEQGAGLDNFAQQGLRGYAEENCPTN